MSTEILVQGTPEWREARATKITGSRVAAIVGASPFTTEAAVMREMVRESLGEFENKTAPPMEWGKDHEEEARNLYSFLYSGTQSVDETGFYVKGNLGASPDALVGDDGLLEIKCPYSLREDVVPEFKSIDDQQYYWHQMQMQMYTADRQWCDFFQWTPHGHKLERVERDPRWYKTNQNDIEKFYERYEKALNDADVGGPQEKLGISIQWRSAAEQYLNAIEIQKAAETDVKDAKDRMITLMNEMNVEQCAGAGIKCMTITRKGSVDYKNMALDQITEDVVRDIQEDYRRASTVAFKFDELKD